jgi:hypothetical protein
MTWQACRTDEKYEIYTDFPYPIRRISTKHVVSEFIYKDYPTVSLSDKPYRKQVIVMSEFNPNNTSERLIVENINGNNLDYRLSNLIWNKRNQNHRSNRSITYEFVNQLPPGAIEVHFYENHQFRDLYFCNDVFYKFEGSKYKKLVTHKKGAAICVNAINIEGSCVSVYYHIFMSQFMIY